MKARKLLNGNLSFANECVKVEALFRQGNSRFLENGVLRFVEEKTLQAEERS